ncbi:MAG TPA: N-acetylmuramoyl-L-alanine amidase, partial [bacterium]|nr:N-acetylmuramoyl-L-alanine amidase [bacterium]
MTDTGIRRIHLENVDDDQVRMVVQSATPIAQPRVRYDPATNRATIRLKPSAPLPEPPKAGTPKGKGLQGKVIVVDAGHGGHDPGAAMEPGDVGPVRLLEKDVNLRMALDLAARLRRAAATVVLSREDDRFIELLSRKELIDTHKADLFISIHCNSFRKVPSTALSGTEVYYYKGADEAVANLFYRHIAARTGRGGRGALQANFVVCKHPSVPSVLVESGYLSNPDEYELFIDKDHKYEQTLVTGIMEATAAFFNGERSLPSSDPEVFTEVIMDPEVVLGELARHTVLDLPGAPLAAPSSPYEGGSEPSTPTPAQPSTRNDRPSRGDIFRPTPEHKEAESPQAERRRRIFSLE